jgi:hypothetical protein
MPDVVLQSAITCPECGHTKPETMPTYACQYFYECTGCGAVLKSQQGDCCVFCSYGSVRCPPMQAGAGCGGSSAAHRLGGSVWSVGQDGVIEELAELLVAWGDEV